MKGLPWSRHDAILVAHIGGSPPKGTVALSWAEWEDVVEEPKPKRRKKAVSDAADDE